MTSPLDATDQELDALAEEFVGRYRRGESPCVADYVRRFPHLAGDIQQLFPAATLLEDLKGTVRPAPAASPLPEQLGDYRLLREVGRGGMGVVYEAMQVSLSRKVALKVLPRARLGPHLARFRREAQAAGRLHHTNIVPVFGVGEWEGQHYYVMQYIAGQGLDRALERLAGARGPRGTAAPTGHPAGLPAPELSPAAEEVPVPPFPPFGGPDYDRHVAGLVRQVADALAYAHGQGVLHRDVKPANLLLDRDGQLWVTDFGLAKLLEHEDLTRPGEMAGTLRYSAPERFQGRSDARSDVFALGLTLYEMCTLRPAYDEAEPGRLLAQVGQARYASPRSLNPALSRDLETVLLRALAPEPERRYQTAAELADDLRRFLEDRPVCARRAGRGEHAWRWCRRNPAVAGLSAALLLVFLAGFAGVAWKWREASANLEDANRASLEAQQGLVREESERRRADEQRRRAEGNLDVAVEAFDRIARQLALARPGSPLETDGEGPAPPPIVSRETAAILQDLVAFYERFTAANTSDPRLVRATATALRRAGTIRHHLGEHGKAEEAYRRAIPLLEGCEGQELEVARAHNDLGVILRGANRKADARKEHAAALAVLQTLPPTPASRLERATAHHQLGALAPRWPGGSEGSYRSALELLEGLVKDDPKSPEARHRLARVCHDLSLVLWAPENRQESLQLKLKGLEVLEKLTADLPGVPGYRADLAEMMLSSTPRLLVGPMTREASRRLGRAVDLARELTRQHPSVPDYQSLLGRARQRLGAAQLSLGQTDEAISQLRAAASMHRSLIQRFPEVPGHLLPLVEARLSLAEALRHKGPLAEAERALRDNLQDLQTVASQRNLWTRGLLGRSYRVLGQVLVRQGKNAEGEQMLRRADRYLGKGKG